MNRSGKITPNFTWEEANCRCGCIMPESVAATVIMFADLLEGVRFRLGALPMHIAAWYRCPAHNAAVGGAQDSQHLLGRAVDFSQKGRAPLQIQDLILQLHLWPNPITGLERDPGHTHIDHRPPPAIIF